MGIGRTILAVLISLSVTMLPAAAGVSFKSTPMSTSHDAMASDDSMDMSAADPMDCCPRATDPCDKAMGGCTSMAGCALKCFSFTGGVSSLLVYPQALASALPLLKTVGFRSQTSSPPFRPPRI
jgi:hypothetical protein